MQHQPRPGKSAAAGAERGLGALPRAPGRARGEPDLPRSARLRACARFPQPSDLPDQHSARKRAPNPQRDQGKQLHPRRTGLRSYDRMQQEPHPVHRPRSSMAKVGAPTVLPPIDRTHGRPERLGFESLRAGSLRPEQCGSGLRRQPTPLLPNVTRPGKKGGPDVRGHQV